MIPATKIFPALTVLLLLLSVAVTASAEEEADKETARQPVMLVSPGSLENLAEDAALTPDQDESSVPVSRMLLATARLVLPEDATLDQAVAAIVRLNPDVFVDGDLERVTLPVSLDKPTPEQVRSESSASLLELVAELEERAGGQISNDSSGERKPPASADEEEAPVSEEAAAHVSDASAAADGKHDAETGDATGTGDYLWAGLLGAMLLVFLFIWLTRQSRSMDRRDLDRRSLNRESLVENGGDTGSLQQESRDTATASEPPTAGKSSDEPVAQPRVRADSPESADVQAEEAGELSGIERAREKIRLAREKALGEEALTSGEESHEETETDEAAVAEEAEQKKRAEEEKARLEAEAKRKAEEERKKAELEKKKREEEKRKAEEEKRKAEARKKAEEERRKAQEARKKAEEERARKQEEKRLKKQKEKERTEWLESLAKDLLMAPENAIGQGNHSPGAKQEHDWKSSLPADYQTLLGGASGTEGDSTGGDAVDRVNAASASLRIARNYVDMGEAELAERLLQDVLQGGNSSQQAAAKALLEKIRR